MEASSEALAPDRSTNSAAHCWLIVLLLAVASAIAYVDRVNLSFALIDAHFKQVFHFSNSQRGLLNSAFFWSYAVLQIPAGWVVDRYGTKYPLAISFAVWSLLTAVTAITTGFASLFAVRLLMGFGEAVMHPASMRWIGLNFPERHRGFAVGVFMSGSKFGPAIGAALSAWLIETQGWQAMFLLLGLFGLIWLFPWLLIARTNRKQPDIVSPLADGETAPDVPMSRLLSNPIVWGSIIGAFSYMYFVYFCLTWMPAYLREARGLSLGSSSLYTTFSFAGMALIAIFAGWAADQLIKAGRDPVNVRKAFTVAGFLLASTEVSQAWLPLNMALAVSILSLSGLGLATANYWSLTQTLIPNRAIGRTVGIQNCAASLPGIVAPVWTGWLVDRTGSYAAPMSTVMAFLFIGVFAYLFLVRQKYALEPA